MNKMTGESSSSAASFTTLLSFTSLIWMVFFLLGCCLDYVDGVELHPFFSQFDAAAADSNGFIIRL